MRKPAQFGICKKQKQQQKKTTKAQISGNPASDQCLCFSYIDSTIPSTSLILNSKPLASHLLWPYSPGRLVSDLVRNPEDRFSRDAAHYYVLFGASPDMKVRCTPAECLKMMHFEIPLKVYQRNCESHSFRQCFNINPFFPISKGASFVNSRKNIRIIL